MHLATAEGEGWVFKQAIPMFNDQLQVVMIRGGAVSAGVSPKAEKPVSVADADAPAKPRGVFD